MFFSQLYLEARAFREGSMIPPRRRRTRWRVDSYNVGTVVSRPFNQSSRLPIQKDNPLNPPLPSRIWPRSCIANDWTLPLDVPISYAPTNWFGVPHTFWML
ncbi:hypothetical protein BJX61DRAFT_493207 [Aspergillus egyptiacus]|nr:hypothetical protein BJX61DRAFT_493207 [Aspergillus egyptiacus]